MLSTSIRFGGALAPPPQVKSADGFAAAHALCRYGEGVFCRWLTFLSCDAVSGSVEHGYRVSGKVRDGDGMGNPWPEDRGGSVCGGECLWVGLCDLIRLLAAPVAVFICVCWLPMLTCLYSMGGSQRQ